MHKVRHHPCDSPLIHPWIIRSLVMIPWQWCDCQNGFRRAALWLKCQVLKVLHISRWVQFLKLSNACTWLWVKCHIFSKWIDYQWINYLPPNSPFLSLAGIHFRELVLTPKNNLVVYEIRVGSMSRGNHLPLSPVDMYFNDLVSTSKNIVGVHEIRVGAHQEEIILPCIHTGAHFMILIFLY